MATEDVTPSHGNSLTLALAFGRTEADSVSAAEVSLSRPFGETAASIGRVDELRRPSKSASFPFSRAHTGPVRPAWTAITTSRPNA